MAKGGDFEREIAKSLSLWFSEGKREDIFYRSHASGGRFTARKKTGKDTAYQGGDITFSDPIGEPLINKWNIEIKTGYGKKKQNKEIVRWDILDFVDSKQKQPILAKFWEQCLHDAHLTNREPVLVFRRNNRMPCICFEEKTFLAFLFFYGKLHIKSIKCDKIVIISLKNFFEWIPNISLYLSQYTSYEKGRLK